MCTSALPVSILGLRYVWQRSTQLLSVLRKNSVMLCVSQTQPAAVWLLALYEHNDRMRLKAVVTPVIQLQGVVTQGAQLLVVLVIANADDGHLAAVNGLNELCHPTPVTP